VDSVALGVLIVLEHGAVGDRDAMLLMQGYRAALVEVGQRAADRSTDKAE
jgi:hypothetical protein